MVLIKSKHLENSELICELLQRYLTYSIGKLLIMHEDYADLVIVIQLWVACRGLVKVPSAQIRDERWWFQIAYSDNDSDDNGNGD